MIVTSSAGALSKVTVKVPVPPSVAVALPIDIPTSSSSVMVRTAVSSEMVALVADDKVTEAVSSISLSVSAVVTTVKVPDVSPANMVNVFVAPV